MRNGTKLIDIELSYPITTIEDLNSYSVVKALIRLHGSPLGYLQLPVINGSVTASAFSKAILAEHSWPITRHLLCDLLTTTPPPKGWDTTDLVNISHHSNNKSLPLVTVAVCTRDRTADLTRCLEGLMKLDYPHLDLLVVDNAPSDDATKHLVQTTYPHVRYVCEPRPGLDWARNRAIMEARGEIVAYTDDDVIVDSGWVTALANVFIEHPDVMAVTGLVVPYELETEAQHLFEMYGGFGRGFERKWFRLNPRSRTRWKYYGTGQYGTGANMTYRRSLFDLIGYFDPALDVGTVTNGGGDLEMFFRVLKQGHTLVYEPNAIVRHRHRREYAKLRTQITNNGIGLYSYFVRSALAYPSERFMFIYLGVWWLWWWCLRRLLISFVIPFPLPRDLIWSELWGCFVGLTRYQKARRAMADIVDTYGPQLEPLAPAQNGLQGMASKHPHAVAVRSINLGEPLIGLNDVCDYATTRIFVTCHNYLLGNMDIANQHQPIGPIRLREAIVDHFGVRLLDLERNIGNDTLWYKTMDLVAQHFVQTEAGNRIVEKALELSANVPVSIVVATLDRPNDLRNCLNHLVAQESPRAIEIVVVDNNPASGLTPPVIAEFPGVVLVNEPRRGLAYARNAGFAASTGDIAIATDDDVTVPSDWLEKLVAPFAQADVMVVTGNVLPIELENTAQHLFERYGGLGRGFEPFEVDKRWFESFGLRAAPTWQLGATANAAFRVSIFSHPQIGLMDEALGPGMPSGVGEDTYLFYKVLKAGYTIVYEPAAYVWHQHRNSMSKLRRQLYSYSKGHIAYNLTTLIRDHDLRGLWRVILELPKWRLRQFYGYLKDILNGNLFRGQTAYPLFLILLEIWGNLAGPWTLWQSYRRVKREGRSQPYIPPSQRSVVRQALPFIEAQQPNTEIPNPIAETIG